MKEALQAILTKAQEQLRAAGDLKALDEIRVAVLGKKGELTALLKSMGSLSKEERPKMGQLVNETRKALEELLAEKTQALYDAYRKEVPFVEKDRNFTGDLEKVIELLNRYQY